MADYVLELEGIQKAFGGIPVLKGVDFRLERGSVHALVGGNGAGKSTLMKILTGVYSKDSGVCKINGQETRIRNYDEAKKMGISLIFQELSLIPTLTVAENIYLNKELKKGKFLDCKAMNLKSKELLQELGIKIDVQEKIQNLSVGVCQLVEIAKALSNKTSVLVMDEPTASLSDNETEILFHIIEDLKKKGISIVYISHRMKEIFQVSDTISVLYGGELRISQPTSQYTLETLVKHMFGGKKNEQAMVWKDREIPIGKSNIIEVRKLAIGNIVKDVSFEVKEGEVVGLAGLMGSGRTEILETIFGIRKSSGGEIIMAGQKIRFKNVKRAIKGKVALVPEDRRREGLVLMHSLRENLITTNLEAVKKYGFIRTNLMNRASAEAIADLNIKADSVKTKLFNLSGGNQQKVVIAKWLNTKPKLLMLDEPTAGVDINAKSEIIEIIRQFVKKGHSVIFVSSELSEMMSICDRVVILHNGRVTGELAHDEITTEEVLQCAIQK
ncbi:sugar ABC transporter ATP-binding protein [Lachnospiraceae bacterium ZAX-1]